MASAWYYTRRGKKEGPVSSQELKRLAESGQLQPTDQVWKEGMAQWVPASKIKGLFPSSQAEVVNQPSPPPLPGAIAGPPSPPGAPKPAQPAKKRLYKWVGLGIGAVIAIAVIANAAKKGPGGDNGKESKGAAAPKVGDEITFKDSKWIVVKAKDKGRQIKPNNPLFQPAQTDGRFILVHFKVTNTTNKEDRILDTPKLIDSKGREFKDYDQQSMYIPEGAKTLTIEALPAGMTKEFWALYDVPADATDLKFQARALSAFGEKRLVELGLPKMGNDRDAKIGEEVVFDDSKWTVVSAEDKGNSLKSKKQWAKDASTTGRFILVRYNVSNTSKKVGIFADPEITDSQGRQFAPYPHAPVYYPDDIKGDTLIQLQPGLTQDRYALYEIPADAKGLKFQVHAISEPEDKRMVDLGLTNPANDQKEPKAKADKNKDGKRPIRPDKVPSAPAQEKHLTLRERLADTKWVNTNKATFEWDSEGKLLHNGTPREYEVVDERPDVPPRIKVIFGQTNTSLLTFDANLTVFNQFDGSGRFLFRGKRLLDARQEMAKLNKQYGFDKLDYSKGPGGEELTTKDMSLFFIPPASDKQSRFDATQEGFLSKNGEFTPHGKTILWYKKPQNGNAGKVCSETYYWNGKQHGVQCEWHKDGSLGGVSCYVEGKIEGLCRQWYADGQPSFRYVSKDGKQEGLYERWYTDGSPYEKGLYKDGLKEGEWRRWNSRSIGGHLDSLTTWHKGQKHGLEEQYEPVLGQRLWSKEWKDGKLHGKYISYDNGRPKSVVQYENGVVVRIDP